MTDRVLIDTGPLVALLSRQDAFHAACAAQLDLAEREDITTLFTLDRRDFSAYRRQDGRAFTLLPE